MIKTLFEYVPFAFLVLTVFVGIVPARLSVRGQAIATMVLLTAFSKFLCFASFGGDAFAPDMPEKMIWVWNGLYSAAVIFMTLSCVWFVVRIVKDRFFRSAHFTEMRPRDESSRGYSADMRPRDESSRGYGAEMRPRDESSCGYSADMRSLAASRGRISAKCADVRVRRSVFFGLAVLSVGLAARGVWNGIKPPCVREVELAFADLPPALDGYRILHLSDLHVSSAARRARTLEVVRRANAAGADLIAVTGDLVDGDPDARTPDVEPLRRLKAPDGVWFSTGNHEFYFDWFGWRSRYEQWGLRFLRNDCVFPRPELALGGVDDEAVSRLYPGVFPSLRETFAASTNGAFRVLLRHRPERFPEAARAFDVRLQLSGHTHGGIMPVLDWLVARHNNGFVTGLYRDGDSVLSISPGAGQWAGFPIRFFNDPEIPLYVLRRRRGGDL